MSRIENAAIRAGQELGQLLVNRVDLQIYGGGECGEALAGRPAIFAFFPHTSHGDPRLAVEAVRRTNPAQGEGMIVPGKREYWFEKGTSPRDRLIGNPAKKYLPRMFFPGCSVMPLSFAGDQETVKDVLQIAKAAKSGSHSILIAPEGTRSNKPFYDREIFGGTALLAKRTGFPIVPMVMRGVQEVLPRGGAIPHVFGSEKPVIEISFGPLIEPANFDDRDAIHAALVSQFQDMSAELYPDELWVRPDSVN